MPKKSKKLYRFPTRSGATLQLTFKELQAQAVVMLTSEKYQPYNADRDRTARNFSTELSDYFRGGKSASYSTLLVAAWRLSVAIEEVAE